MKALNLRPGLWLPPSVRADIEARKRDREIARAETEAKLRDNLESNAEFQRNKTLSRDEIGKRAVEKMTSSILTFEKATKGESAMTEEQAREKAIGMQDKFDKSDIGDRRR